MVSPAAATRYLSEYGLRQTARKLFRTQVYARERMYLIRWDPLPLASLPLTTGDFELRLARPDDRLTEAFPHLRRSWIAPWFGPGHFFHLALHKGTPVAYRCLASTAGPLLDPFLRLRAHQLYAVDRFTRPEFRRRGLLRIMKIAQAHAVVPRGIRDVWAVESVTNHDAIISSDKTGTVRVGTLIRTSVLGRLHFSLTPARILPAELIRRQLGLLRQLVPALARVGVLFNPSVTRAEVETSESTKALAAALGVDLVFFEVRAESDQVAALIQVFSAMAHAAVGGLIVLSDPMLRDYRRAIVGLVNRYRLPAVYDAKPFVDAGGLMAYGAPLVELRDIQSVIDHLDRQASTALDAQVPPPGLALTVNRRAAAALGLEHPLLQARQGPALDGEGQGQAT